jgi:hypothetical protein
MQGTNLQLQDHQYFALTSTRVSAASERRADVYTISKNIEKSCFTFTHEISNIMKNKFFCTDFWYCWLARFL